MSEPKRLLECPITGKPCKPSKKKLQFSKKATLIVLVMGFVLVQECFFLMYKCIESGYASTASWLTAAVGLGQAVIIAAINGYFSVCKIDHKDGGITAKQVDAAIAGQTELDI